MRGRECGKKGGGKKGSKLKEGVEEGRDGQRQQERLREVLGMEKGGREEEVWGKEGMEEGGLYEAKRGKGGRYRVRKNKEREGGGRNGVGTEVLTFSATGGCSSS